MFDKRTQMRVAQRAVSTEELMNLSTNFLDIISECGSEDMSIRNELQNYFPLASYLMNTPLARVIRERSSDPQKLVKGAEGWELSVPGTIYTLEPVNSSEDCCWTMPDFSACATNVPLMMLCLKDCDNIFDKMIANRLRINSRTDIAGIARPGESVERVNERIRTLWFAFYLAHTAILGTTTTSDNITKPFHGLLEVLTNPAVMSIDGTNVLAAFRSVGCRLAVLGGDGVFAINPLLYRTLEEVIVPDEYNRLPSDWTRRDGELYFMGMRFIRDKLVPVDLTTNTGDIWYLSGDAVGLFFGYNLNDPFVVRDDFTEEALEDGCGTMCTYLYNFGAVASNNANRLMVISGVPISSACTDIYNLAGLINPQTLIPA